MGVFLAYVTPRGHTLIDRELYLPQEWTQDRDRCRRAGIEDTVAFRTKLGELLYWIGHPGPNQWAPIVASGIVAAKQLVPNFPGGVSTAVRGLRLDGSSIRGNSGGGAFDQNGLLCGLICASPRQVNERHLTTLVASLNGGQGQIGGVDVAGVLRGLLEELSSTTRPGIAYAVGVEEIQAALPTLLQRLP